MNITFKNYPEHSYENKGYNLGVKPLIDEILQTHSIGKIGYLISSGSHYNSEKKHSDLTLKEKSDYNAEKFIPVQEFINYSNLGPLEFCVSSYILNKNKKPNILVITGAIGSGKSSLIRFVIEYLKNYSFISDDDILFNLNNVHCNTIDFNGIYDDNDTTKVLKQFYHTLITQLIGVIEHYHHNFVFCKKFIAHLKSVRNSDTNEFRFLFNKIEERKDLLLEHKIMSFIYEWIFESTIEPANKLKLLSILLNYIVEHVLPRNKEKFFLVFDNIDRLQDKSQIDILNSLFSFADQASLVTFIVPMRLTTFSKIKGNASYSFSVLENLSRWPGLVLLKRIQHFLNNLEEYSLENYNPLFVKELIHKIKYIESCLGGKKEQRRLLKIYNALSGDSVRRGLFLSERFFLNSAYSYKEDNLNQDQFVKALLVDANLSGKMANDDLLVCNLFTGADANNELISVRILQITSYSKINNIHCTISLLLQHLDFLGYKNKEDIISALNNMMQERRKLINIACVDQFENSDQLNTILTNTIQITFSGLRYLNELLYDMVYLQCSFEILQWSLTSSLRNLENLSKFIENILEDPSRNKNNILDYLINLKGNSKPKISDFLNEEYDYKEIDFRMRFLREALYLFLLIDFDELARYETSCNPDRKFVKNSIITDIFSKVSVNVLRILSKAGKIDEIENWYNALLLVDLWHNSFFNEDHINLNHTIKIYNKWMQINIHTGAK